MQERMQKMEKQKEEQNKIVRQEVMADVIAQLKHALFIDRNILAALSTPSPRESTSAQGAEQGWCFDCYLLLLLVIGLEWKSMLLI